MRESPTPLERQRNHEKICMVHSGLNGRTMAATGTSLLATVGIVAALGLRGRSDTRIKLSHNIGRILSRYLLSAVE